MAITKLSDSSITTGDKYISMLAGNTAFNPYNYESIATVTVGSGGTTSVDFNSITSDYTHLQIRGIFRITATGATYDLEGIHMRFNSDTANNYAYHRVLGTGSSAISDSQASMNYMFFGNTALNGNSSGTFATAVIDILDYKNTNKFKTMRTLNGIDLNGGGRVIFGSNLWRSTSAITDIKIYPPSTFSFVQYSQFALYGIKGS